MNEIFLVESENWRQQLSSLCTLFQVLYDGLCPICVTEIRFLQFLQKNRPGKVVFIDISLPGYDGEKYRNVSYEMAMEEMHVIDEKDKVILQSTDFSRTVIFWMSSCYFGRSLQISLKVVLCQSANLLCIGRFTVGSQRLQSCTAQWALAGWVASWCGHLWDHSWTSPTPSLQGIA